MELSSSRSSSRFRGGNIEQANWIRRDNQRLSDELLQIERSIDQAVEDARRIVYGRLQAERDRVMEEARMLISEEKRRLKQGYLNSCVRQPVSVALHPKFLRAIKELSIFCDEMTGETLSIRHMAEPLFLASTMETVVQRPTTASMRDHPSTLRHNLYESMNVFSVIKGKDALGCVITEPTCATTLVPTGSNSCAAFSHNDYRITTVDATGKLLSTYMLCHDVEEQKFFKRIINMTADDVGRLLLMEADRHDTVFAVSPDNNSKSMVVPTTFVKVDLKRKDGSSVGRISGIAVSLAPVRLLYATTGMDVRGFSLDNGSELVRCKLPLSYHFATTLLCTQRPGVDWHVKNSQATSFLVYSTWDGSDLYRSPIMSKRGQAEMHESHVLAEGGPSPGNISGVAAAACDLEGNVLIVEKGNRRIQVFSTAGRALCTFAPSIIDTFVTCGRQFEPRGIAVISSAALDVTDHRRPIVIVTDPGLHSVLLFSPKFR